MKIWIFKPSEKWSYCGGARIAIAKDIVSIKGLFETEEFFEKESDIPLDKSFYIWVLVETFSTTETKERIILNDYNWN